MNWDDVGNAIQRAIVVASGLLDEHVVWKDQNVEAPENDYVAIQIAGMTTLGIDYIHKEFDANRPRGEEFKISVRGQREVPLQIECFTADSISGRKGAALALCSRILAALVLPDIRNILNAQDVSPFDPGIVQWIPDVPSTNFRGRAVAVVRCYMPPPTVEEYIGYIERVSGIVTVKGGAGGDVDMAFDTGADGFGDIVDGGGEQPEALYAVYFGVSAVPGAYNSAFITGLSGLLRLPDRHAVVAYSAAAGQRLYYATPSAFGTTPANFIDNETNFQVGSSVAASGVSVGGLLYDVIESDVDGLGVLTVRVT